MIETVNKKSIQDILPLIRAYQEFYGVEKINDENNLKFFSQFGEKSEFGCQFLYREDSVAVGFSTIYFTFTSTITAKVAVMNDLYVSPDFRGKEIGKKLILHSQDFASAKGATRLQWVTAKDNLPAQKLYESLNTKKNEWFQYILQS